MIIKRYRYKAFGYAVSRRSLPLSLDHNDTRRLPVAHLHLRMKTSIVTNGAQLQGTYSVYHVYHDGDDPHHIDRFAFNGLTKTRAGDLNLDTENLIR